MTVMINEFEVMVDETPERPAQVQEPAPNHAGAVSPREIIEILRHRVERLARVEAH